MAVDLIRQDIAAKVLKALEKQGKKKKWLYHRLEMHPQTLQSRLETNAWSVAELIKLQDLLGIK